MQRGKRTYGAIKPFDSFSVGTKLWSMSYRFVIIMWRHFCCVLFLVPMHVCSIFWTILIYCIFIEIEDYSTTLFELLSLTFFWYNFHATTWVNVICSICFDSIWLRLNQKLCAQFTSFLHLGTETNEQSSASRPNSSC